MYKVLLLLAILPCLFGAKPSMKNALRNQVLVDLKNNIVPIISKKLDHLILPDIHTSSSGFKIDVTNIHVHVAAINPAQIYIQFVPNTSTMRIGGSGFGMTGSAHIHAKWTIISKSMDADVGVKNAGFACQFTIMSVNGKPNIKVDSVQIHLSSGDISIHIHGGIIEKILQFLANLLKGHFLGEIIKQLQSKLPAELTTEVNKILNTLPTDIDIGQGLAIKYSFPYAPFVKQDYLFTGISAYVHAKNNPNPPPYEPADIPEFDAANPKGIQFFLSEYIVKSSLDAAFAVGLMAISLEKDMLGHHIKMACKATKSPEFKFVNAVDVLFAAQCEVLLDKDPKTKFTLLAEIHVNLKEYMKQAVIFFTIVTAEFTKLEYKQENPIDIEWFKNGINQILAVVKEIVNNDLGQRGIPLPVIQGIDYTDTVEFVKAGYMEVCTTPHFHFTTENEA